ncbi:uncharacterized protein LOC126856219 [Cataglyphis hispanica]|uniref:uncharacterized protein LOC126856219 n=1 Tax=Cataglyphis hispanica TaxID=1086592 RepID=UPI0021807FA2|nr:uncharacterized protein LOC126856219 [Cataglyphis hispanica]
MTINLMYRSPPLRIVPMRWIIRNIAEYGSDRRFIASGTQATHVTDTPNVYRMGIAPCSKYYKSDLLRVETIDAAKRPCTGRPTLTPRFPSAQGVALKNPKNDLRRDLA